MKPWYGPATWGACANVEAAIFLSLVVLAECVIAKQLFCFGQRLFESHPWFLAVAAR